MKNLFVSNYKLVGKNIFFLAERGSHRELGTWNI